MTVTLKITHKELEDLINYRFDESRFKEIFNDIPMYHPDHEPVKGETHRDFSEDDGREYRWFIFQDIKTNEEYCINYTYNSDWPNDIMDYPSSIEIVKNAEESDLYKKPEPVIVPEPVLSTEEKADKELWAKYQAIEKEVKIMEELEKPIPKKVIKEITDFLKLGNFNMLQLRAKVIPVCIEYQVEQQSLWRHVQSKAYSKSRKK